MYGCDLARIPFKFNEQRCIQCGICMDLRPVHRLDVTRPFDLAEEGEEGRELEVGERPGGCDMIALATHGRILHRIKLPLLIVRPQMEKK